MTVFHERYQGSHEVSVFIPLPGVDHGGHGVRENEPLYGIWEGLLSGITGRVLGQGFGWAQSLMQLSVFK